MPEAIRYKKYEPIFGSWYIKNRIGKGAVGQVYEIERKDLGKTYKAALKAITIPEGPDDIKRAISTGVREEDLADYYRDLVSKIATEFQYLAELKGSSYVVNYEDHLIIEDEDDFKWDVLIKTELLTPLVEHAIENPLDVDDVVELGIDICRALEFCAQFNIIHRDIKPENIFIGPSGTYKLGDFGIARVAEETQVNLSRKGTYTYMAPEVFHGEAYGQSADLYSLGIVMYKYLNHGRVPFMPDFPEKIQFDDAEKSFSARMSGLTMPAPAESPDKLSRIVLKACAYEPENRYRNAGEMLSDLEELHTDLNKNRKKALKKHESRIKGGRTGHIGSDLEIRNYSALSAVREREERLKRRTFGIISALVILAMTVFATYTSLPKEVTDITGIDENVTMYYDETLKPEYIVEPKWFEDEEISFISTDAGVFGVSDTGELTAETIGEADLIMHAKEYTETVHVSIVPKVTEIGGIEKTYSLTTGDTLTLKPKLRPKKFADEKVTYKSKDKSIMSVDKDGTVTALKAGTADITIKAGGASRTATITVADPVIVYSAPSTTTKTKKKTTKTSNKNSGGYFESGDDEYFGG